MLGIQSNFKILMNLSRWVKYITKDILLFLSFDLTFDLIGKFSFLIASEFISSYYPLMSRALKLNQENYTKLSRQILEEIARNKTYGKTYRMITQKHL